jgi:hypothetical protein
MASSNRKARWLMIAAIITVPVACDTLRDPLDVEPASRIPAGLLEQPQNAKLLSDGAIGDFECALASYVANAGLVGEEFIYAQQTASRTPYDRRNTTKDDPDYATNSCVNLGVYTPLHIARQSNENLLALLKTWSDADVAAGAGSPDRTDLMGIAAAYAGYSLVLLGEGFCTMAVSSVNTDKTVTYGGEIQPDSVFRLAIARFTEAIDFASTAGNTAVEQMAYLGRARAKLNLGDYEGAASDAAEVPVGYLRNASASDAATRRQNRVFMQNSDVNKQLSVGHVYRAMTDLRVPVDTNNPRTVSATGVDHYFQEKYLTSATPLPLATYEEAQLIIAEAHIRANRLVDALPILQASRARGGQGLFVGTTQAEYLAELIDQRRRELFAEGHHLGDVIRYGIALTPAPGTPYHFGGNYGDQVCLPLPAAERLNNPLIGG